MGEDSNFKRLLNGKSVEEQITFYKDYYDTIIQFDEYYRMMFPDWDGHFNTKCRLHDEENGESFGYNKIMNLWTCWGACQRLGQGSGRVVFYHYTYRKKYDPQFNIMKALKELYKMFKNKGNFLPYPKIYESAVSISLNQEDNTVEVPKIAPPTVDINIVELFTSSNSSLSKRVLVNFTRKKDKNASYSERKKLL